MFGARHQGRDGIDYQHVDGAGAHQGVGDFQRLFAGVGLRDQQFIDIDTELLGIAGIECVFGIDEGAGATHFLGFGDHVQGQGRLAGAFRPVDLDNAPARQAADAEADIEADGARGNGRGIDHLALSQAHDRALAESPFDLSERGIQGLAFIHVLLLHQTQCRIGHLATPLFHRPASRCNRDQCTCFVLIDKRNLYYVDIIIFYEVCSQSVPAGIGLRTACLTDMVNSPAARRVLGVIPVQAGFRTSFSF